MRNGGHRDPSNWKSLLREVLPRVSPTAGSRTILSLQLRSRFRRSRTSTACVGIKPQSTEGYGKAEVTAGGVDTGELSAKTMEARKCRPFLYREVVDVTGQLGASTSSGPGIRFLRRSCGVKIARQPCARVTVLQITAYSLNLRAFLHKRHPRDNLRAFSSCTKSAVVKSAPDKEASRPLRETCTTPITCPAEFATGTDMIF